MPSIIAKISMKTEANGGRPCGFWASYRPHLVPDSTEDYLGVSVVGIEEADAVLPGTIRTVQFQLMYPGVDYSGLAVGSRFKIREGQRSVGEGIVIERIEEES